MAVQAQYPTNILFLNNRNGGQETKNNIAAANNNDGSLQPQLDIGGDGVVGSHGLYFNDQSQMFFNSNGNGVAGGGVPRKRGRTEISNTATTTTNNINPFNFSLQNHAQQQHQPQIIDLTQLHNRQQQPPPPNGVSTGLRLSFGDEQQKQHRIQQQHHNHVPSSSSYLLSVLSDEFANEIKQQTQELNQFIQVQGEHLRSALAEKSQTHYRTLIQKAEQILSHRITSKEAEIQKANRRNAELEARAAQLTAEAQIWQAKAQAQESEAATLQAQLQQVMLNGGGGGGGTVCTDVIEGAEDAESAYVDPERVESWSVGPICKSCRRRTATAVVLPCRHLCVCGECDGLIRACPVCLSVKNGSIQVYLT